MPATSAQRSHKGRVLNIQRMSTEDGPGIRTTVFLKGCSLACTWCHNPESLAAKSETVWQGWKCIDCRSCAETCPEGAISYGPDAVAIDRALCRACGTCAEDCPGAAMQVLGQEYSVDALVDEVAKDRAFFEKSGGGITVSGGEPTLQAPFVAAFLERVRAQHNVHVALDTCGMCNEQALDSLLDHSDLVLFDLKEIDPANHERLTGHSNAQILQNLSHVKRRIETRRRPLGLWIRTPLVPGATATEANLSGIGAFLALHGLDKLVQRWELCAFNNLCQQQYRRLGKPWQFEDQPLMEQRDITRLENVARQSGVDPQIVFATGAARAEAVPSQ